MGTDNLRSKFGNLANGSSIIAVDTKSGSSDVVLTYDDGPEPQGTTAILDALEDHKATATFFVLLTRARKHPSIIKEILDQGHEIALHGVDHQSLTRFSSEEVYIRTCDAKTELENLISQPVRWFRPPYGHQSEASWQGIERTGLVPVVWNVQCGDWEDAISEDYEQYLVEVRNVSASGSIILMHDNFAEKVDGAADANRPLFDRGPLARKILKILEARGFTGCSLESALKTGDPTFEQWFKPQLP